LLIVATKKDTRMNANELLESLRKAFAKLQKQLDKRKAQENEAD